MSVYFIGEDNKNCSPIKIGRAKDISKRIKSLQTGNSSNLKLLGWINTNNDSQYERMLHDHFDIRRGNGEWFYIEPVDIVPILKKEGSKGFIAKNANAFEITGYDKDAVPEYLGVWEWDDLEISECCPFCGCFCGMHFQEASQMYYCIECDTLTGFFGADE